MPNSTLKLLMKLISTFVKQWISLAYQWKSKRHFSKLVWMLSGTRCRFSLRRNQNSQIRYFLMAPSPIFHHTLSHRPLSTQLGQASLSGRLWLWMKGRVCRVWKEYSLQQCWSWLRWTGRQWITQHCRTISLGEQRNKEGGGGIYTTLWWSVGTEVETITAIAWKWSIRCVVSDYSTAEFHSQQTRLEWSTWDVTRNRRLIGSKRIPGWRE